MKFEQRRNSLCVAATGAHCEGRMKRVSIKVLPALVMLFLSPKTQQRVSADDSDAIKIPSTLTSLVSQMQKLAAPLSLIKYKPLRDCGSVASVDPQLTSLRECVIVELSEITAALDAVTEATSLVASVYSGGRKAHKALVKMRELVERPYGRESLRAVGTPLACLLVASKESTPDLVRSEALSLLSVLTDLPSAIEVNDAASGSFGHVNLVLPSPSRTLNPDRTMAWLSQGLNPDTLPEGNVYGPEAFSLGDSYWA